MSDDLPAHALKVSSWCFGWDMYAYMYDIWPKSCAKEQKKKKQKKR